MPSTVLKPSLLGQQRPTLLGQPRDDRAPKPTKWQRTAAILNEYNPIDAFWRLAGSPMASGGEISDQNIADGLMVGGTVMGGGAMIPKPANALNMGIRAFHGSPHSFDKFSMDKIGTGEGAQAYGRGLYFAENEGVATGYKHALAPGMKDDALRAAGVSDSNLRSLRQFTQTAVDPNVALRDWLSWNKMNETPELRAAFMRDWDGRNMGHMYEVDINADPNAFLDWDKPLSEQPEAVRNAIPKLIESAPLPKKGPSIRNRQALSENDGSVPGDIIWNNLGGHNFPDETRKRFLEAGIPGIKYLDAGSRGAGDGTRNYVVFDDKLVSIVKKYGIAGASAMLGYNVLQGLHPAQAAELKKAEGK